jgi:6-pyruvoyltetrahydropterin/6-carboxytetrahydropterin synthase
MMRASVTRTYRFSASHRLHTDALSEDENFQVFGKCNNPYGHGHNYEVAVTVRGGVNPTTGLVVNIDDLDSYVRFQVLTRVADKNLNLDVTEFENLVPTTENLAVVISNLLSKDWNKAFGGQGPVLSKVGVRETERNSIELVVPCPEGELSNSAAEQIVAAK